VKVTFFIAYDKNSELLDIPKRLRVQGCVVQSTTKVSVTILIENGGSVSLFGEGLNVDLR
jgi:hypothetical protein